MPAGLPVVGGEPGAGLLGTVGELGAGVTGVAPAGLLPGGEVEGFVAAVELAGLLVTAGKPGAGVPAGLLLVAGDPGAPVVAAGAPAWPPVLPGAPGAGVTEVPTGLPLVEGEPGAEVTAAGVPAGLLVTAGEPGAGVTGTPAGLPAPVLGEPGEDMGLPGGGLAVAAAGGPAGPVVVAAGVPAGLLVEAMGAAGLLPVAAGKPGDAVVVDGAAVVVVACKGAAEVEGAAEDVMGAADVLVGAAAVVDGAAVLVACEGAAEVEGAAEDVMGAADVVVGAAAVVAGAAVLVACEGAAVVDGAAKEVMGAADVLVGAAVVVAGAAVDVMGAAEVEGVVAGNGVPRPDAGATEPDPGALLGVGIGEPEVVGDVGGMLPLGVKVTMLPEERGQRPQVTLQKPCMKPALHCPKSLCSTHRGAIRKCSLRHPHAAFLKLLCSTHWRALLPRSAADALYRTEDATLLCKLLERQARQHSCTPAERMCRHCRRAGHQHSCQAQQVQLVLHRVLAWEPGAMVMADAVAEAARGHTGRRWLGNMICSQNWQVQGSPRQAGAGGKMVGGSWLRQWGQKMLQVVLYTNHMWCSLQPVLAGGVASREAGIRQ